MTGLSNALYQRRRTALLKCSEFDSDASLRAVFVTDELRPFRDRLTAATNKSERVDTCLDFLLDKRLSDGRPVLPLFLVALRDGYQPGDALRDELNELHIEVSQALSDKIIIPFVVATMTQSEVTDLMAEIVFDNPDVAPAEYTRFQELKQELQECGLGDWHSYYGGQRESWKPVAYPNASIQEIIFDILDYVNDCYQEPQHLPCLLPHFLSDDFFAEGRHIRKQALRQLRQSGGVLIIDAISMFHPVLNKRVSRSGIGSNRRVAILVVSPMDTSRLPVNRLIEQVIDLQMETAFTRFGDEFDRLCEVGVGDLRGLKRWLFAILPETAANVQRQKASPANLQRLQQMRGEEPSGIGPADFMFLGGVR